MPVRLQFHHESGADILVWKIAETQAELLSNLPSSILTDQEYELIKNDSKKNEMLASRLAINALAKSLGVEFDGIKKDEFGKPFLANSSWQFSLTHSKDFIAVIFHPFMQVGIDIELPSPKLWKIKQRLFSEPECEIIGENLELMSLFWSAKESLYKLYGKRGTDFKENLKIERDVEGFIGKIDMPPYSGKHRIYQQKVSDYLLVWSV